MGEYPAKTDTKMKNIGKSANNIDETAKQTDEKIDIIIKGRILYILHKMM
ncbi:MAG: hypothetical protein Q4D42_01805 [Eubacteriales bacterium]|nr:hypothetical protein [Eubacteriales bacterium]